MLSMMGAELTCVYVNETGFFLSFTTPKLYSCYTHQISQKGEETEIAPIRILSIGLQARQTTDMLRITTTNSPIQVSACSVQCFQS